MTSYFKYVPKRIFSLILAISTIASLLFLPSCAGLEKDAALRIDSVNISDDVTAYFLDQASTELGFENGKKALEDKTVALCMKYFKTNTLANAHHIKLTVEEKAEVSEKVNATWSIFGNYYNKIGVRKDTLTKIFTTDVFRDKLILAYYGKGGTEEIPESRLYASFKANYVVFQAITGYFTTTDLAGNQVSISQNEIETLILQFQNARNMVNSGEHDMNETADILSDSGVRCSVQTVVLHKDDDTYPAGFFEKVQSADSRQATVVASNEYIFLVLKGDVNAKSEFYTNKKVEIIKSIVGNEIDNIIDGAYDFDYKTSAEFNTYYSLIKKEKDNE